MFIQALNFYVLMGSYFLPILMSFIQQKIYKLGMISVTLNKKTIGYREFWHSECFIDSGGLFFFMLGMQLMLLMVEKGT